MHEITGEKSLRWPRIGKRFGEQGIALIMALMALAFFSLAGLLIMLNASADLQISVNAESQIRASCAALAGLSHSRALLRGLSFDQQLKGPDGTCDSSAAYQAQARTWSFRNPFSWGAARALEISNPVFDSAGLVDDGLINTGSFAGAAGIALIPLHGIPQVVDNPLGSGTILLARYFVKITDDNGSSAELAGDPADDPFHDGDGIVIARSMGVAGTIRERAGGTYVKNSVVVFEAQFKRCATFRLPAPLVLQGSQVNAAFAGNDLSIDGGAQPGIAVIDTDTADSYLPEQALRASAAGHGSIVGGGLSNPSIADVTAGIGADPDHALLLDSAYLWKFAYNSTPRFADSVYRGDQNWSSAGAPYLGSFDVSQPMGAPAQDPKVTFVDGNLSIAGNVGGAGLLVVTGNFSCEGGFKYDGLVLVIGSGNVSLSGTGSGISGGLYIVRVSAAAGATSFGPPAFSMSGGSYLRTDTAAVNMAVGLIPVSQVSFREVTSSMDP